MTNNMNEIIYILINEAMPGYVKIGKTNNLEQRRLSLSRPSGVPLPFEVYYASEVEDAQKDEQWLHYVFADRRVRDEQEFFKIDPERIVAALKRIEKKDITPKSLQQSLSSSTEEEKKEVEEKKKIRSKFDFKKYDIPIGSEVIFSRDASIKAKVLPNNKIELGGKETSLSKSAQELLGYNYGVAGTLYWMYEDESLDERRRRMEDGE